MSNLFYHYTDINALISILKKKELWLSSIYFMNDQTEGKTVFTKIYNSFDDSEIQKKVGDLFHLCLTMNQVYATSFTKKGDHLSQWRGYCPDEGGYSIGFDFDEIDEMRIGKPSSSDKKFKLVKTAEEFLGKASVQLMFDSCMYSNEDVFKEHIQVLRDHVYKVVKEITVEQIKALKEKPFYSVLLLAKKKKKIEFWILFFESRK